MTDMINPAIEQHFKDGAALMERAAPIFDGVHSFVMMTVLASLTAQWLLSHPEEQHDRLVDAFGATVADVVAALQLRAGVQH
jgi:hypothetical protein